MIKNKEFAIAYPILIFDNNEINKVEYSNCGNYILAHSKNEMRLSNLNTEKKFLCSPNHDGIVLDA